MGLFDSQPGVVELPLHVFRFVDENHSIRQQVEHGTVGARHGRVEFPAGKHGRACGAHRLLNHLFGSGDALARKAGMDCAQKLLADWSLGERQQQSFVHRVRRALRSRVELADGLDFIPEEFNPHRPVGLGGIHIEDAATQSVLTRHLHHIRRGIADRVQVAEQRFGVNRIVSPHHARQLGIVLSGTEAQCGRGHRRNHNRDCSGCDLP